MSASSNQSPQPPFDPRYQAPYEDDEIDLAELWAALYQRKILILGLAAGLAVLVAIYSLTLPNQYKASALLAPASSESGGGLASQYGGLASLAGISLPKGETTTAQTAMAVMQSRKFLSEFIAENKLKQQLFFKQWDADNAEWVQSFSLIGTIKGWFASDAPAGPLYEGQEVLEPGEPSMWNTVKLFSGMLSISEGKDDGMITVSIEWTDPVQARDWVTALINRVNTQMRVQQIEESQKTIDYLQEQLQKTQLVEIKTVAYKLIEQNMKNMTLAKTQQNFVFKVIDPAVVPEEKSAPKRSLMVAVALVLGGMLGIFIALIQNWRENKIKLEETKDTPE
ncbi:MAG: LPS O-antigen length regulator [Thiomicrospira sp.]|nr:LPS O-antigen length regulator [Thiomicrospira sp.]PIZ75039.1 MAG: LPS O-antigen length regulator [Piscirickettsiaceae bacterium CG_4_10_14_0_2_um_filter_44_336]